MANHVSVINRWSTASPATTAHTLAGARPVSEEKRSDRGSPSISKAPAFEGSGGSSPRSSEPESGSCVPGIGQHGAIGGDVCHEVPEGVERIRRTVRSCNGTIPPSPPSRRRPRSRGSASRSSFRIATALAPSAIWRSDLERNPGLRDHRTNSGVLLSANPPLLGRSR